MENPVHLNYQPWTFIFALQWRIHGKYEFGSTVMHRPPDHPDVGGIVLFFIIRAIVRSSRRKLGIPKGTGKTIQHQLKKIDQLLENDERQTAQWARESQPLDISNKADTNPIPDFSYESDPLSSEQDKPITQHCPACGAPVSPGSQSCEFCGSKIDAFNWTIA